MPAAAAAAAAATARRRRAVPVRHSRTRDTSQVTKSSAPSAMSKRYPVNGVRPRGRDSRLDGARHHRLRRGLASPAAVSNAAALADRYSGRRRCFPSVLRCSPPRAGWQLRRERRPPGNSAMVMVSGSGLAAPPPRPTPARTSGQPWDHASASNDFRFHKKVMF